MNFIKKILIAEFKTESSDSHIWIIKTFRLLCISSIIFSKL
jgi:hypothetical protein